MRSGLRGNVSRGRGADVARRRLTQAAAGAAWNAFETIELRVVDVDIGVAIVLAEEHGLYAYDAYILEASRRHRAPLLTLDRRLERAALAAKVTIVELQS